MFSGEKLQRETFLQQAFLDKKLYHSPSEQLGETRGVLYGDVVERACFIDPSFQNDTVPVRIESKRVSKCLMGDNGSCLHRFMCNLVIKIGDKSTYDL